MGQMYEILEQLNQMIEARVEVIKDEQERKKPLAYQKEMKEQAEHMNRILLMLPEDEREWLDARLVERLSLPMQEREQYYKVELSDAIEFLRFLKT